MQVGLNIDCSKTTKKRLSVCHVTQFWYYSPGPLRHRPPLAEQKEKELWQGIPSSISAAVNLLRTI